MRVRVTIFLGVSIEVGILAELGVLAGARAAFSVVVILCAIRVQGAVNCGIRINH